jgi:predicted transposase/invertase (TIGR01784 family)
MKNLHKLDRIPEKFKENIFLKLFDTAEIAKFNQKEYQEYEDSLKYYRNIKNSLDTAKEEGKIEGKIEVAKNLLRNNVSIEIIINSTGLTKEEIENLK